MRDDDFYSLEDRVRKLENELRSVQARADILHNRLAEAEAKLQARPAIASGPPGTCAHGVALRTKCMTCISRGDDPRDSSDSGGTDTSTKGQ